MAAFVRTGDELRAALSRFPGRTLALADGADVCWGGAESLTLVVAGRAIARLELCGHGTSGVFCRDHAELRLTIRGEVKTVIRSDGEASLRIKTHGASQPAVALDGRSRGLVRAYDASRPSLEAFDLASPWLEVFDQARPHCRDWPAGWEARASDVYFGQPLVCFATEKEAVAAVREVLACWRRLGSRYLACLRVPGAMPRVCPNAVDCRWDQGTVHLELPGADNPRPWYSTDAHHLAPLTEARRQSCTRYYLD
jgi:hypothetical protein